MKSKISIASYNSHGSGAGRLEYIKSLFKRHDILLIQEHWLLPQQFHFYNNNIPDCNSECVSGMRDSEPILGRPFGGCAILWNKNIQATVTPVNTDSNRICAINLSFNNMSLFICSIYMPTESSGNLDEFKDSLNKLSALLNCTQYDAIIIGGDFNTCFDRNSKNLSVLKDFMSDETLKCGIFHKYSNVIYSFESKIDGRRSLIDHFMVTENIFDKIVSYDSDICVDNLSDHIPVCLHLDIALSTSHCVQGKKKVCINWKKVTDRDKLSYKQELDCILEEVPLPVDVFNCNSIDHNRQLQGFYDNIICACVTAGQSAFVKDFTHRRKENGNKSTPGWSLYVKKYKEKAVLWHSIWKANGCPREGLIANIRRATRAEYHKAIKYIRREREAIVANKMANDLMLNKSCDFWSAVKQVKKGKVVLPNCVDSCSSEQDISNRFASKYEELYNCVSYNPSHLNIFLRDIDVNIKKVCCKNKCYSKHRYDFNELEDAISCLKEHKVDSDGDYYSNHILCGSDRLKVHLMLLFNAMTIHGTCPSEFFKSLVIPIPKNKKKSLNDSNNYRGIALSNIVSKILDLLILKQNADILSSSNLQFGFKHNHSTMQCTFVLNEIIQYYRNKNSDVYVMFLDASKAFDRVQYTKLFQLLCNKGLCPLICRMLCYLYTNQTVSVKWGSKISRPVSVTNGVKQGGILSPVLFTLYMDTLFAQLKSSGSGCHIGNTFMGAVGYADDVALLAPSLQALHKMLGICDSFGNDYSVLFNIEKYQLLHYSNGKELISGIWHNNIFIERSMYANHLGNIVGPETDNIYEKIITKFMTSFNGIDVLFRHAHVDVKYRLFKTYCMDLYGSIFWVLDNIKVEKFYIMWRKCLRKLYGLPCRTHSKYIPLIVNDLSVQFQLFQRLNKFVWKLSLSENPCVQLCRNLMQNGSNSNVCKSFTFMSYTLNTPQYRECMPPRSFHKLLLQWSTLSLDNQDYINISIIHDLLYMRQHRLCNFTSSEINDMLVYVCTS